MLNISENVIPLSKATGQFESFGKTHVSRANVYFKRWLLFALGFVIVLLFLPWTQNIQSKGKVTTLRPEHRPQTIDATIAGRIEHWYVREGELIKKGDTIVFLSEIKAEYFDPELVNRTGDQVAAKTLAIGAYDTKVMALTQQIEAMRKELQFKNEQLRNKIEQGKLKIAIDSIELERAKVDAVIADRQYRRADTLNRVGIKPLTEVEDKRVKLQETTAKLLSAQNKLLNSRNELINARLDLNTVANEYAQKIAKAESDRSSTQADRFDATATVSKLEIEASNYSERSQFYYITAPQDCYITKTLKPGVGETVKENESIVTIMPVGAELAVELYIKPMDFPLIAMGQEVRFIFDGWPAFIFSGWPGQSFGTYRGRIAAIDNNISENGKYRILVAPEESDKVWPEALRPGSGAQGIALLNNVPLWYEIWRKLNGFPPDYYQEKSGTEEKTSISEEDELKLKAPVKSVK